MVAHTAKHRPHAGHAREVQLQRLKDQGLRLRRFGFEGESGLGEESVMSSGRYWILLSRFLTMAARSLTVGAARGTVAFCLPLNSVGA
jgi:hypothetical protein